MPKPQTVEPTQNQMNKQEEVEEEEIEEINSIEKLQELGVNVADINKLKSAGIFTVKGVLMTTRKELCNIKGLSDAKIDKMLDCAQKIEGGLWTSAKQVEEQRQKLIKLTTGASKLDELLGGGIEAKSITEVYGEYRTGKTQLCHTVCVTAQMPRNMGGGNGKVVQIDTEGSFRTENIKRIAIRFNLDPEQVLQNIVVGRAYNVDHMFTLLNSVAALMLEDPQSLIIVDSIMALFRVDFSGRGELADRQQKLASFINKLIKISLQFNTSVLVTNQVMADPSGGMTFAGADNKKPIGGHILAHYVTTRLYFKKGRGDQRICKMVDSPHLPESECIVQIGEGGIVDSNE